MAVHKDKQRIVASTNNIATTKWREPRRRNQQNKSVCLLNHLSPPQQDLGQETPSAAAKD